MILAAGKGTRMGKISNIIPKPLTKINKYTLIELNILRIKKSGIKDLVINVSWLGNKIVEHLGSGKKYGVNINYSDETKKLLGTGGGIKNALPILGKKPFWIVNSDLYTDYIINQNFKLKKDILCHLILVEHPKHNKNGDFDIIGNKVTYNSNMNKRFTYSGISFISPKLFDNRKNKKFSLEPLIRKAAKMGKVTGEVYNNEWIDIGTIKRLKKIADIRMH